MELKSCKAPVKSSQPTSQHPVSYRPDALPVAQPTASNTEPILDLIGANEVVSGDNWSYKTCKDPVKMSPPTNQHEVSFYRPDVLPVAQPSASEH